MQKKMMPITGLIMTHNNEFTIKKCINSFKEIIQELIIIDDYSTDKTLKIAKVLFPKVKVYKRALNKDYASQRNFALSKASNNWVLFPDSDEELSEELKKEILETLKAPEHEAYISRRDDFFFNYWIKDTSGRPILLNKNIKFHGQVHEDVKVKKGYLKNVLYHHTYRDVETRVKRINIYSSIDVEKWISQKRKYNKLSIFLMLTLMPPRMFIKKYFFEKYWRRGLPGLLISAFAGTVWVFKAFKLYEKQYFKREMSSELKRVYGKLKR